MRSGLRWILLIYGYKFTSAFQPRLAIPTVTGLLFGLAVIVQPRFLLLFLDLSSLYGKQ